MALNIVFMSKGKVGTNRDKFGQCEPKPGEAPCYYFAAPRDLIILCDSGKMAAAITRDYQFIEKTNMPRRIEVLASKITSHPGGSLNYLLQSKLRKLESKSKHPKAWIQEAPSNCSSSANSSDDKMQANVSWGKGSAS